MQNQNIEKLNQFICDQSAKPNKGRPLFCRYCNEKVIIKDRLKWELEKHTCSECGEIWCDKPETERMLMILQDEYLEKRDKERSPIVADKILKEMTVLLFSYVGSLFKKSFSNMIRDPDKFEEYKQWAVSRFIEQYLQREDFKVLGSFKGMLIGKMQEAIWGKQEKACAQESLDFEFEDGNTITYEDNKKSIMDSIIERHEKEQLVDNICNLIFGISEYCTQEENWIRLLNFRNYIYGGEKFTDKFFEQYANKTGKMLFLQTIDIVREELKKSDRDNH